MRASHMFVIAGLGMVLAAPTVLALDVPGPLATTGPVLQKGGQAVPVDQLPTAVTAAIMKAYPGSTIVSAAKVDRAGQIRYQLSVKTTTDAQPIAVMASADGMIRAAPSTRKAPPSAAPPGMPRGRRGAPAAAPPPQGETVAVNQLPKVVVQAIKDAYPRNVITDAVRFASGSQLLYRLTMNDVSSVLPMLVVVSSDGKIQKR